MTGRPAVTRRAAPAVLLAVLAVLVAGCAGLPDRGPIRTGEAAATTQPVAPFDFDPPGPSAGATSTEIVTGFLRALQATPTSTRVAREYLTSEAASTWRPQQRTLVFQSQRTVAASQEEESGRVTLGLGQAFELDSAGRWAGVAGPRPDREANVTFGLRKDRGEWRIGTLPDAMIIPETHFATRYRGFSLYFFDVTGSVLVPEPVYLPLGVQAPTLLVAGLLQGPPPSRRTVERSYVPPSTELGVSVPVDDNGVADVQLSEELPDIDASTFDLALAQVAWTLRQVEEIDAFTFTVNGTPVELPDGHTTIGVGGWSEYSPALASASTDLFGIRRRTVVQLVGGEELPATRLPGDLQARSLGVSMSSQLFAVVDRAGGRVVVMGRKEQRRPRATTVYEGSDVLRPLWDRTDRLWLLDRAAGGTRVSVVHGSRVSRMAAPLLADREVVAAALSRDGTRLVVALGRGTSRLMVFGVVRTNRGAPIRLTRPRHLPASGPLVGVRAVGWRAPQTVAVLTRPSATTTELELASVDGSSGRVDPSSVPDVLFDAGTDLAASPGGPVALLVGAPGGRLHGLEPAGRWQVEVAGQGLTQPTFVG